MVLGFHAGVSAVFSGIGSARRKKGFWKGFAGGLAAGGAIYAGNKMAAYAGYSPVYAYGAKAIHSLGVSTRDNLFLGYGPFKRYQIDFGPARLSFGNKRINDGHAFNAYLLPGALAALIWAAARGDDFDPKLSLKLGTPFFLSDDLPLKGDEPEAVKKFIEERRKENPELDPETVFWIQRGIDATNTVLLGKKMNSYDMRGNFRGSGEADFNSFLSRSVMGHEVIHTLQYREVNFLDGIFETGIPMLDKASNITHMKLGSDLVILPSWLADRKKSHDRRLIELEPVALELK
ncbi:MAG: hypothetical protein HY401_05480 [Elusimicrobia bacterium]|nr:hypothetical protein [Elusimicrobiota bacterium]